MMHFLLSGLVMVLVTVGFNYAYGLSGVQNIYLGLYKGVVEEAVVVADTDGTYMVPKFHLPRLRSEVERYFAVGLPNYCQSYEVTCYGYSKGRYVTSITYSSKIRIVLDVTFSLERHRTKTAYFSIERSEA